MTRTTNARIAGAAYLLYIVVAFPMLVLFNRATKGDGVDARMAQVAESAFDVRISAVVLTLACTFCAIVLAIALWNITRDEDSDIALLGLVCRVAEALPGAVFVPFALGMLALAIPTGANAVEPAAAKALFAFLLDAQNWAGLIAATFFAVGSTCFAFLFLRGRIIPAPLAWLGLLGSAALAVALPLQLAGFVSADVIKVMWWPLAAYEIPLGFWLIIKGAAVPRKLRATGG